ncbi:MAG: AMP-binding protein [Alphaproteobacteria bacterium]|nr:AMP-binding protein [Alphaproteobacteria bacterium]
MQGRGIGPDARVAILMTNQSRWLVAAAAAFRVGAVVVPLDYKLSPPEVDTLLGLARPALLVTEFGLGRRLEAAPGVLAVDCPASADPAEGWTRWEDVPDAAMPALVPRERGDIATLVYSSGTGGTPKGCLLSHGAYLAQLEALVELYPMLPGERFFSILPTNHAIDFMCGFLAPFACGATVVHQRTLRPEFLRASMQRYAITHLAAVPMILESLKTAVEEKLDALPGWQRTAIDGLVGLNATLTERRPRPELSQRLLAPLLAGFGGHLKLVFTGGAFVRPELADFFYRLGIGVVIGYGLTEACTVITVNDLKPFRADSVGLPVRGTEIRVVGAGAGGVGEVQVRGPTVMSCYDAAPELTAAAFTDDGWLRTGDLGWRDASGHLHLVGRQKNMIVTAGGKNIYPEDIEGAFGEVPCDELAVFAADYVWPRTGGLGDEELVAVVRGVTDLHAVQSANRKLPDFKRVAGIVRWDGEFPRTASMKLQRGTLAEQLRAAVGRDAIERLA